MYMPQDAGSCDAFLPGVKISNYLTDLQKPLNKTLMKNITDVKPCTFHYFLNKNEHAGSTAYRQIPFCSSAERIQRLEKVMERQRRT